MLRVAVRRFRPEAIGVTAGLAGELWGEETRRIVAALMRDGRVRRAYLGIAGGTRPLPPRMAASIGQSGGVEIAEVVSGSPAAQSGLRAGDIIVRMGDTSVEEVGVLQATLSEESIGAAIELTLVRGSGSLVVPVTPVELSG